jgi:two-component system response regulator RegA
MTVQRSGPGDRPKLLLVDDDAVFRTRLASAIEKRGYQVIQAHDSESAMVAAAAHRPMRAVVDLRMPGKSGLDLVGMLHQKDPEMQILVLTGFGSIATAVESVRRGAMDYLNKPVDADQILAAFERDPEHSTVAVPEDPPSLAKVEWEHIHRILTECNGNITQAARKLGLHRRSLQRKLAKLPPLE